MSRNHKGKRALLKGPAKGADSGNPFDRIKRTSTNATFTQKKQRRSKFVNNNTAEASFLPSYNRKTQKLQLYNLNEPIQLTHKNEPIEDHYEDDLSDHSEDDFRFDGDVKDLPQALEEHKQRRAMERQVKESQRNLLAKLDTDFESMDMTPFMRPKRGTLEYIKEKPTVKETKAPDKFEQNLRHLMAAPQQSRHGGDLLKQLYAAKSIAEKCNIAKKFISGKYVSEDPPATCIVEIARPLGEMLESQPPSGDFCSPFETMMELVHYLCQRNTKGYKDYFSKFLGGIGMSFQKEAGLSPEAVIVLFFLLKVMRTDSALYKAGLIVLERLMDDCKVTETSAVQARLLLAAAYAVILESGLYIPSFYKLCMGICTNCAIFKRNVVEAVIEMVIVSLRILSAKQCRVYPICLHIILPNIASIDLQSAKLDNLKTLVEEFLDVKLRPTVLDIYLRQTVDLHIPKYSAVSIKDSRKEPTEKDEKELYKSMKRRFTQTALADAKRRSIDLQKKREKSKEGYRKVVREAMMEQEMLRKEFTKPT
ncbi:hypothetical protein BgAZ_502570 [Babesia gibsoni]|uniref:Uncharacterized protein n=1 Tax=Babesia gibsoni TaxID=33632 RepID=A0AAD8LQY2_BABGI|nr:hypothetical protein BgAZ_502570 [Babesia gibsoni]